jgi:hypothetical protein
LFPEGEGKRAQRDGENGEKGDTYGAYGDERSEF